MKDENKRKEQLIRELVALRRRVAELGNSESDYDQAEKAWREKEGRCRNLFEQSKDALYMTTQEGDHIEVNQSFLDLFGYTREELRYLKAHELYVNPSDRRRFQQKICQ
jgi:PAS domain-containing protein